MIRLVIVAVVVAVALASPGGGPLKHELPECKMNVSQMIEYHGYPVEEYTVETADGYLLGVQRIPHGRGAAAARPRPHGATKPIAFLQHGLLCSSTNWVANLPEQSLGFMLADAGYDVWLGNMRGNHYSKAHKTLSTHSEAFWDFSWDEMAKYDLPAMLDYALKTNGGQSQVYYIGHSQGTLIGFAGFSENLALGAKVKQFHALGPVATLTAPTSPITKLAPFAYTIKETASLLGVYEFMPNTKLTQWLGGELCTNPLGDIICSDILFVVGGFDKANLNMTRVPVYVAHTPAGTSMQNMEHFAQMVNKGTFQMYDFGKRHNEKHYNGSKTPPMYDAGKMQTPVALYYGGHDTLADPTDVKLLIPHLNHTLFYQNEIPEFSHLDFIWGIDANRKVYDQIITFLNGGEEQ